MVRMCMEIHKILIQMNMKKSLLLTTVMFVVFVTLNAQFLKTNFFSGYATGVALETNTYTIQSTSSEPLVYNTWSRARSETGGASPTTVVPLTYSNYIVSGKDVAAQLQSVGSRTTVNTISSLTAGTYYLACLFKPTLVSGFAEFIQFDNDAKGATLRARVAVKKGSTTGKLLFGINQNNTESNVIWGTTEYDLAATYLVVLKVTVGGTNVSLYINPTTGSEPLTADISGVLAANLATIRGVAIRQKATNLEGILGGIAITDSWNNLFTINVASTNTNISELILSAHSDINVSGSGELLVNENKLLNSITVTPNSKLTVNEGVTLTANSITLQSSTDGTATLVDNYTTPTVNAIVQQYVEQGRNWYISSPISSTPYTVLNKGTKVVEFNESTKNWVDVTSGNLTPGRGYIQVAAVDAGSTGYVTFQGTTNSGNVDLILTRNGTTQAGFNLVGNPYPSYLNWTEVAAANPNVLSTAWFRTKNLSGNYIFATINVAEPEEPTIVAVNPTTTITTLIPPMQAYWVRVVEDQTSISYRVTNAMREHLDISGNKFKAPRQSNQQLLRLQVSDGTNSDETVIYLNVNATNGYDRFDSPKMSNNSISIPEIYTMTGSEQLVINGLKNISLNEEMPLGFKTSQKNSYSIKASEIRNFDINTHIFLRDKIRNIDYELTKEAEYKFTSDVTSTTDRFVLIFKSSTITTGSDEFESGNSNVVVFKNINNQIVIDCKAELKDDAVVLVYNTVGQKVVDKKLANPVTVIKSTFQLGTYIVKVTNGSKNSIQKIIFN